MRYDQMARKDSMQAIAASETMIEVPAKVGVRGRLRRREADGIRTILWFEKLRGRLVVARPRGILRVAFAIVSRRHA